MVSTEIPAGSRTARADNQATWSLVLGIASLFCGVFTGLPALILGMVARRNQPTSSGETRALIGIVTGGLTTLLTVILVAITIPRALEEDQGPWLEPLEEPAAFDPRRGFP